MSNFWLYNPAILFDKNEIMNFWPKSDMELSQKLNAITRIVILLTIIGLIFTRSLRILITSIITLIVLVILYKTQYEDEEKEDLKEKFLSEGFANQNTGDNDKFVKVFRDTFTNPTEKNPLMNVMMDDYKYNPQKKRAAPAYNNNIKKEILEKAKPDSKLFLDLGDSLAYENNMRNFYSMPNTQIPNDQKAFANFCFGSMTSCKEGNTDSCSKVNRRIGKVFY
jgi:hypothetical protein